MSVQPVRELVWEDRVPVRSPLPVYERFSSRQNWTTADELKFIADQVRDGHRKVLLALLARVSTRRWDSGVDAVVVRQALEQAVYGEGRDDEY